MKPTVADLIPSPTDGASRYFWHRGPAPQPREWEPVRIDGSVDASGNEYLWVYLFGAEDGDSLDNCPGEYIPLDYPRE